MMEENKPVKKAAVVILVLSVLCFAAAVICLIFVGNLYALICFVVHAVLDLILVKEMMEDEEDIDTIMERTQEESKLRAQTYTLEEEKKRLELSKADVIAQRDETKKQLDESNLQVESLTAELKSARDSLSDLKTKLTREITNNSDLSSALEKNSSILPPSSGEPEVLNIADVASAAVNELKDAAKKAGIEIHFNPMKETILVRAEADRIRILFRNIIDNSIKYMGKSGQLIITISTIEDVVFIVLKDNGNGLGQEEVGHIFELNYQGSNRISGNGLGLSQAKAIVDYYGGNIYAKSSMDNGMGIYIQLPAN